MAKKKVQKPAIQPAMTKKQMSRWQKEKRQERLAIIFVVAVVALIVVVLGAGYYQENLAKPNAAFAKVNGVSLPASSWVNAMVLQYRNLEQQADYWQTQLALMGGDDETTAYYRSIIEQQQEQVVQAQQGLIYTVPDELMAAELIRQETEKRGLAVTQADIDALLIQYFTPEPQEPVTDTTSTTPTPTPLPADAWKTNYKNFLTGLGATEAEYKEIALVPGIRREKLQIALSETVPVSGEQIRVSHIVTDTSDAANAILARVQAGEDFAALAKELSGDTGSAEIGGDLGWYPRGLLADEFSDAFEAAVWSLTNGAVATSTVQTYYGYHVVKRTDSSADRPYDSDKRALLQSTALDKWLTEQMASPAVERFQDSDKLLWVQAQVTKRLSASK